MTRHKLPYKVAKVYFLPPFLQGVITEAWYNRWLTRKAKYLFASDKEKNKPCAVDATAHLYKESIHQAVLSGGQFDPFTGDALQWELVCTWDYKRQSDSDPDKMKKYALLPTVDHIDPYAPAPAFEICSWLINRCKNNLSSEQFVAFCEKIIAFTGNVVPNVQIKNSVKPGSPQKYFLPQFLSGIITEQLYLRWLRRKASHLFHADLALKKPCACGSSAKEYKALIHAAVLAVQESDPYTGEKLSWDLIGTWNDSQDADPSEETVERFGRMPTVDHIDPYAKTVSFEICSWLVNRCKANQTQREFIALCEKIVAFRARRPNPSKPPGS